jgi:hypothetical protein
MKKAEFYINVINGRETNEYPKVSGWVEEVEDSKGRKIQVGYDKVGSHWRATEILTGYKCNTLNYCRIRADCVKDVHNNIDIITNALQQMVQGEHNKKYIQPFRDFVNSREV